MHSFRANILSLKSQKFSPSGCKAIGIIKKEKKKNTKNIFQAVSESPNLKLYREGLRLFLRHFLLKKSKLDPSIPFHTLEERVKTAESCLSTPGSKLKLQFSHSVSLIILSSSVVNFDTFQGYVQNYYAVLIQWIFNSAFIHSFIHFPITYTSFFPKKLPLSINSFIHSFIHSFA